MLGEEEEDGEEEEGVLTYILTYVLTYILTYTYDDEEENGGDTTTTIAKTRVFSHPRPTGIHLDSLPLSCMTFSIDINQFVCHTLGYTLVFANV